MKTNCLVGITLVSAVVSFSGCQSWQGAPFPLPNATRVPPPGTGTYQLPSGYYNNATSALPNNSPTPQLANANVPFAPNNSAGNSGVTTASFVVSPNAMASSPAMASTQLQSFESVDDSPQSANLPATMPEQSTPLYSNPAAAASLSDSVGTEVPSLQWQQFDGQ